MSKRGHDKLDKLPDDGLLFVERGRYDRLKPSLDFIPGWLHDSTVAFIYGPSGSSKTFLALHLLCSAALGRPVFGETTETRKGLYVGLEGEAHIKSRILAWCVANKVESNPIDYALGRFHLANKEHVDALIEYILDGEIQFVVIDTLSIAMAGLDEIAGQHMTAMLEILHRIKRETGACVVALAHTGKNEKAGIRGHSSQLGNVDTTIEIICHNKETVHARGKARVIEHDVTLATPRSANLRKQRDGEGNRKWHYGLTLKETSMRDARGNLVSSPAVDECDRFTDVSEDAPSGAVLTNAESEAMAVLRPFLDKMGAATRIEVRNHLKRREWRADTKSEDTWGRAFRRLIEALADKHAIEIDSNDAICLLSE